MIYLSNFTGCSRSFIIYEYIYVRSDTINRGHMREVFLISSKFNNDEIVSTAIRCKSKVGVVFSGVTYWNEPHFNFDAGLFPGRTARRKSVWTPWLLRLVQLSKAYIAKWSIRLLLEVLKVHGLNFLMEWNRDVSFLRHYFQLWC